MPKGVEHSGKIGKAVYLVSVESLMPKGVEHVAYSHSIWAARPKCRISDAERR